MGLEKGRRQLDRDFHTGPTIHRPQQPCHGSSRFFRIKKLILRAISMLQIRRQVSQLSRRRWRQGFSQYRRRLMSSMSPSMVRILFRVLYAPSMFPSCTITVLAMNFRCFAMTLEFKSSLCRTQLPQEPAATCILYFFWKTCSFQIISSKIRLKIYQADFLPKLTSIFTDDLLT